MLELEERVESLEEVFREFLLESSRMIAANNEAIAEIRASNARTDHQLLVMQQQAERDRERADRDRDKLTAMMEQADKDRESADRDRDKLTAMMEQADMDRESADRDREKLTAMMEQADKDRESADRDREKLTAMMEQADKDRERADRDREKLTAMMEQADEDRKRVDDDRKRVDEDRKRRDEQREQDRLKSEEEWQRRAEESKAYWKQVEKDRKDFNRRLAEATDSQGLMIENMVWPNLNRVAKQVFGGGNVLFSGIRVKRRLPTNQGRLMELDLLAVGEKAVLICEAKSKVDSTKVREFLEKLAVFPEFFPEYAGLALRPMIASIYFDPSVVAHMTALNVIALGFGDETMEVLNPEAVPATE